MGLPVQSIRALPEHREMLQRVAELLRRGIRTARGGAWSADTVRALLARGV